VKLSPLCTSATNWPIVPAPDDDDDDDDECGVVGGMRIGRGNRSTRRKPAPAKLCTPQIPHELTWARTPPAAVGSLSYGTAYNSMTVTIGIYLELCSCSASQQIARTLWNPKVH
jgi:hypothetical protein